MVERMAFDEVGLFDEEFRRFEDWDWVLRFIEKFDLVFVPTPLVTVRLGQPPRPDSTLAALDRLRHTHSRRQESFAQRQRFSSALLVELAAVHSRSGRLVPAVVLTLAALATYPFRDAAFFRSVWRWLVSRFQ